MTHDIHWPGTKIVRSTCNAFTAHLRGDTTIDWAKDPDFRITVKQRQQRAASSASGWGNGDMGPLSPRPRRAADKGVPA